MSKSKITESFGGDIAVFCLDNDALNQQLCFVSWQQVHSFIIAVLVVLWKGRYVYGGVSSSCNGPAVKL